MNESNNYRTCKIFWYISYFKGKQLQDMKVCSTFTDVIEEYNKIINNIVIEDTAEGKDNETKQLPIIWSIESKILF